MHTEPSAATLTGLTNFIRSYTVVTHMGQTQVLENMKRVRGSHMSHGALHQ